MKSRLEGLIGPRAKSLRSAPSTRLARASCASTPRRWATPDFVIYDDDDQVALVKQAMRDIGLDEKRYSPRAFLSRISAAKTVLAEPEQALRQAENYFDELAARTYRRTRRLSPPTTLSTSTTSSRYDRAFHQAPRHIAANTRSATCTCWWTSTRTPTTRSTS